MIMQELDKLEVFMNYCFKDMQPYKVIKDVLSIQHRSSILHSKHQVDFHNIRRIQSSKHKHERHESTVSKSTQPVSASIWY